MPTSSIRTPRSIRAATALLVGAAALPFIASAAPGPGRAGALGYGIENVNDSPLKSADYRALLRFVPRTDLQIDRFYFGFKLKGASCWPSTARYGAGDGGTMLVRLVDINETTGLPAGEIAREQVNGCDRHRQAKAEVREEVPVFAWANLRASLKGGRMYAVIISNVHGNPAENFFSFNTPIADAQLAGPHARNELSANAVGALVSMDPREHVAWSGDRGATWRYGQQNGQYLSYMNDRDLQHPAVRLPQYGFRTTGGVNVPGQPYYGYLQDCVNCTVAYDRVSVARQLTEASGFTAGTTGIGTLTVRNLSTGQEASCTPRQGYGYSSCTLSRAVPVAPGQRYSVSGTGSVELMKMDYTMQLVFPDVGDAASPFPGYQPQPAPGTKREDLPSLWAGPLSPQVASPPAPWTRLIEAESFTAQKGVQTQACSEGGSNLHAIDATDWAVYGAVNVPTSGAYRVEYRVASATGGALSLDLNAGSRRLGQLAVPATGGLQRWTTISHVVDLPAGTWDVGVYAVQSGWNLNWIRITKL